MITNVAFSQTNPSPSSPRTQPSLATEITNINTEIGNAEGSLFEGYIREAATVTYLSNNSFSVAGNVTAIYALGRRIRLNAAGTPIYVTVASSSFNAGVTTVLVQETTVTNPITTLDLAIQAKGMTNPPLYSPVITTPTVNGGTFSNPGISGTVTGNPTIQKPTLNGVTSNIVTDAGANPTFDMTNSAIHYHEMGGDETFAVTGVTSGGFILILKPNGHTPTWWNSIVWQNTTPPVVTPTAGRWDIFSFLWDGNRYYGSVFGQNYG